MSYINLVNGLARRDSLVAQRLDQLTAAYPRRSRGSSADFFRPFLLSLAPLTTPGSQRMSGVWKVIGSIPVGVSEIFSLSHVRDTIFLILPPDEISRQIRSCMFSVAYEWQKRCLGKNNER